MTGGWDRTLRFWDMRQLPTQNSLANIQLPERVYCSDMLYPMAVVALANRHVKIYKLEGQPLVLLLAGLYLHISGPETSSLHFQIVYMTIGTYLVVCDKLQAFEIPKFPKFNKNSWNKTLHVPNTPHWAVDNVASGEAFLFLFTAVWRKNNSFREQQRINIAWTMIKILENSRKCLLMDQKSEIYNYFNHVFKSINFRCQINPVAREILDPNKKSFYFFTT